MERVVSGTGLANIYEFFAQEFPKKVNQKVHAEFMKVGDMKGKVVATNAKKCERAYYDITQLNEFKKTYFTRSPLCCASDERSFRCAFVKYSLLLQSAS